MTNLFQLASQCLHNDSLDKKLAVMQRLEQKGFIQRLRFDDSQNLLSIEATRFPEAPIWVDPRRLARRKFHTPEGKIAMLHAIAHIEFIAIHLAWDIAYRFRGLPQQFYRDWLFVAREESQHFSMLRKRLNELGADYGDLSAHGGLWAVAEDTTGDVLARLALVPRYMEARGLDVTPDIIGKLKSLGDQRSVAILSRILEEEVGHVETGTRWFNWICEKQGLDAENTFFDLIRKHLRGSVRGPFNHQLRKAAGFSEAEIDRLERLT